MARLRKGRLRWAIAGGLVIALVVAAVVAWPYVQRYTGSAPPPQFYDKVQLEPALAPDYPRVLGVAHNAGDNLGTLSTAMRYGGPSAAYPPSRAWWTPPWSPGCTRISW